MKKEELELANRITEFYGKLLNLSHLNNQTVGEKRDYYITLEQLENALMAMKKSF